MRFLSELIGDREDLKHASIGGLVEHEFQNPHVVREHRLEPIPGVVEVPTRARLR